jgi:hypothetical protein
MKAVYYDLQSGISGDMILASLIELFPTREEALDKLKQIDVQSEFYLHLSEQIRSQISTLHVEVETSSPSPAHDALDSTPKNFKKTNVSFEKAPAHSPHRNLNDIFSIIEASAISPTAKQLAKKVFTRLGEAEASVHNVPLEQIHFHEVGAVDSIVDIVGSCVLFAELGLEKFLYGPFYFGSGSVKIAHGVVPLPVPAVAKLTVGKNFIKTNIASELVTPTGAALLTTLGEQVESYQGRHLKSAFVSGTKNIPGTPGFCRADLIELSDAKTAELFEIITELNIDDQSPEELSHLQDKLFSLGAKDVFVTPILMKKGRAAQRLSVLHTDETSQDIHAAILKHTTTFGFRSYRVSKMEIERKFLTLPSSLGDVSLKIAWDKSNHQALRFGEALKWKFEYEDLARMSTKHSLSIAEVRRKLEEELDIQKMFGP